MSGDTDDPDEDGIGELEVVVDLVDILQRNAQSGPHVRHEKSENLSAEIAAVPRRVGGHEGF